MGIIKTSAFGAYALVVFRDEDGDAPAIKVSESEDESASLIVFDRAVAADESEDDDAQLLIMGRLVRSVPRGLSDGSEEKPSWYEREAVANGGN